jgi:FPC/CPF motif-containing protein YcgG
MAPRKHPSGSKKRKRKKEVEEFIESQRGAMDKFVRTNTRTSSNEDQPNLAIVVVAEQPDTNEELEDHDPTLEENVDINTNGNDVTDHDPIFDSSHIENDSFDE